MRTLYILSLFLLAATTAHSDVFTRAPGESAQQFIDRIRPDSLLSNHTIIETDVWPTFPQSIIAFYSRKPGTGDTTRNFGHLYIKDAGETYTDIEFAEYDGEHEFPEILAVFFANADKDSAKELIVMTKYSVMHYDMTGDSYDTYIYDNPQIDSYTIEPFSELSDTFSGCECFSREGPSWKADFKTAASVKKKLRKMGF